MSEAIIMKRSETTVSGDIFRTLIQEYERNSNLPIRVKEIARSYSIHQRKVYDFFNILMYFGVCKCESRGSLNWIGYYQIKNFFLYQFINIELDSLTKNFSEIFKLEKSPSIGQIANKFISMFIYFGVDKLNKRMFSHYYVNQTGEFKNFERRLYLALEMLDVMNIIKHTNWIGEYQLLFNFKQFDEEVFKKRFERSQEISSTTVECYLNGYSPDFIQTLRSERFIYFQKKMKC